MAVPGNRKRSWWHADSETKHLLLLYNCYLQDDQVERSSSLVGRSVTRALGLQGSEWPTFLDDLRFLSLRQVGVPLKAGYHFGERLPTVLLSVLVLCEGPWATELHRATLCCPERKDLRRAGLRKGSVIHVVSKPREDVFVSWPRDLVCGLADLGRLRDLTDRTRAAFGSAARAADLEVKDHISHRNSMQHTSRPTGKSGKRWRQG